MSWFDSPPEILTLLSIGAIICGILFWIIDSRLNKVLREFKPNGGTSMRDQLNRIEAKIDGHLNWHLDRTER
jgi:hypothetical protein